MFDLYQYLPRFAAAKRLARNGSQTSFIPDVFARAAEQIRRIPSGERAASPTDRLTLRATNRVSSLSNLPLRPSAPPPRLLYPLAYAALPPATLPFGVAGRRRLTSEPGLLAPARSIGRHNKKSKR